MLSFVQLTTLNNCTIYFTRRVAGSSKKLHFFYSFKWRSRDLRGIVSEAQLTAEIIIQLFNQNLAIWRNVKKNLKNIELYVLPKIYS